MGNSDSNITNSKTNSLYQTRFWSISDDEIVNLRKDNKIIDVDWFDKHKVDYAMSGDNYFTENPDKKQIINDMVEYFLTQPDKTIYKKKTNYLCNRKERICICNTHANDFRKIYDGINYTDDKFIAWVKKPNEPF